MSAELPRLAVTGGTGFVGRAVIRHALDEGFHVKALIRKPEQAQFQHENLRWVTGALGDNDYELCENADCLIHIAGLIKARRRQDYFAVNANAAGTLAQAADTNGVKRLILLSSMAAQVPDLSDYAASKREAERLVRNAYSGALAIIRAPAVFGPGDVATAPFYSAMSRGVLPVPGGRGWHERRLSMVYVQDLVSDIVSATQGKYDGMTVSPATVPLTTWPEFAAQCSKAADQKIRAYPLPLPLLYGFAGFTSVTSRLFGVGHLTLGKLNEFLYQDWSSKDALAKATPLDTALKETLKYYKVI